MTIKSFNARHGITVGANTVAVVDANGNITANTILVGGSALNSTAFAGTANNASFFNGQPAAYYTNASNLSTGTINVLRLPTSGVTANVYGNSSSIPVVTVDTYGRVTSISTSAVAGVTSFSYAAANSTLSLGTGDGSTYTATISAANSTVAGVVTVLDSTTNTSITIAASANTVKNAFDRAIDANTRAASAQTAAISAYSNAVSYTDSAIAAANVSGAAAIAYSNATSFASSAAATAYSNAVSTASTDATNKAANAYSNAVSYAASIAGTAYSNAVSVAASDATSKANNAYTTAVSAAASDATTKANGAYTTAVAAAASDASSKAGVAYVNATSFAANASNINSGTLAEARLPYRMNQNVRTTDTVEFGNMTVTGNLTVTGTTVTVNANNLVVQDNMIYLNDGNVVTNPDLGIAGNYNDGTYRHAGFFRDASDGVWKVYDQYLPEPDATPYIDTSNASFRVADFQANVVTMASANVGGATINSTSYSGAANNASYLGTYAASAYPRKSEAAAVDGAWDFSNTGIVWSGHSYTNTLDGSNVYQHIGTATSTNKIWNLRVFKADNNYTTFVFNSAGVATAENSYRAPIFYDIDNTSYYFDGASTSAFNVGTFAGSITASGTGSIGTNLLLQSSGGSPNIQFNRAGYQNWFLGSPNNSTDFGLAEGSSSSYVMYFKSGGNVGIGTTSPAAKLQVIGNAIIGQNSNSSTAARLDITAGGSGYDSTIDLGYYGTFDAAIWHIKRHGTDNTFRIAHAGNGPEEPVIVATTSGNVGVGTTSPATKLHVGGGSLRIEHPGDRALDFIRSGASTFTIEHDTARMYFYNASTANNIMSFSNASNVGIGVADADYKLDVRGIISSTVDVRAPIFYDSNNTGFYIDPATGSNLTGQVQITGGTAMTGGWNRTLYLAASFPSIVFNSGNSKYSGIAVDYTDANDGMRFWVNGSSADISGTGTIALRINTGNYIIANDVRATIFYDSNDTAYYVDPASASILNEIRLSNSGAITYNDRGRDAATVTLPNWRSRSVRWDFVTASSVGTSGNYAGLMTFSPWDGTTASTGDASYQMAFGGTAVNGGGVPQLRIRKGIDTTWNSFYTIHHDGLSDMFAANSFRAPIFYDSDNTSYYTDPAATSVMSQINFGDSTKFIRGGSSGQTILGAGSVNDVYVQVSSSYYPVWNSGNFTPSNYLALTGGTLTGNLTLDAGWSGENGVIRIREGASNDYGAYIKYTASDTFEFGTRNGSTTDVAAMYLSRGTAAIYTPISYDSNNTAYYLDPASTTYINQLQILGGNPVYPAQWTTGYQSSSDFADGTLVTTDIPATASAGDSFIIEIVGKSYSATNLPFKVIAQGYLYNDTIINYTGASYAGTFSSYIKAFQDGGVLKFWWPRISYWNSFEVRVISMDGPTNNTITRNRVTSITNATEPTGTKKVQINLGTFMRADVTATNAEDLRAPIFYDSNNTVYYIDGAGTSVLNVLRPNTLQFSSGNQAADLTNGSYFILRDPTANPAIYLGGADPANYYDNTNHYFRTRAGSTVATINGNGIYAPVFYDSNDTNYYVDSSSNSVLNTLYFRNSAGSNIKAIYANYFGYSTAYRTLVLGNEGYQTVCIGVDPIGNLSGSFNGGGSGVEVMFKNGVNFITPNSSNNGYHTPLTLADGYAASGGSLRAPIFYDQSDTGYYVDPNGTSRLGTVQMGNVLNLNGWQESVATTSFRGIEFHSVDNRDYYIGKPAGAWTQPLHVHFYTGIWYRAHSAYGGHKFYNLNDGGLKFSIADGDNNVRAYSAFYAPIMYDIDNTAYYADPATTSNLVGVQVNGTLNVLNSNAQFWGSVNSAYQRVDSRNEASIYARAHWYGVRNDGATSNFRHSWYDGSAYFDITADSGTLSFARSGGAIITSDGSWRAPIFYDSDNTAYYLDPGNTSTSLTVAGKVGIGITSPTTNLDIYGGSGNGRIQASVAGANPTITLTADATNGYYPAINFSGVGGNIGSFLAYANQGMFYNFDLHVFRSKAGTEYGRFAANGNFGIGTSTPNQKLVVSGTGSATSDFRAPIFYDSDNTAYYFDGSAALSLVAAGQGSFGTDNSGTYGVRIRARASDNNVSILSFTNNAGSTSWCRFVTFSSPSPYLYVEVNGAERCRIDSSGTVTATGDFRAPIFYDSNNTAYYLDGSSTGTSLNVAGAIIAAGNITAYSDSRVKENVATIQNALARITQIRGVTYTRIDLADKSRQYAGVIAQEIERVLPEAIFDNGNLKAVDYNATIGLLIEAIKEQQLTITEQSAKINTLEAKLDLIIQKLEG